MEKSKPSEVEVIKLGEKIVKELKLEPGVNTLGRWMSHYIAELIQKAKNSESKVEEEAYKKECFEVILKLWENLESIPNIDKPLSGLESTIELLDSLKKTDYSYPLWDNFLESTNNSTWKSWIKHVKEKSENIFELSLYSSLNSDLLNKKKEWMEQYRSLISEKELKMFEHLEYLVNRSKSFISIANDTKETINFDELSPQERLEEIFNRIELELHEVNSEFEKLKTALSSEINSK